MDAKQFDTWREMYDEMSYEEHRMFAQMVIKEYPNQEYWDRDWAMSFFKWVTGKIGREGQMRVLEIGGYDGAMAARVLKHSQQILRWTNIEMVTVPRVCKDIRYEVVVPQTWIWEDAEAKAWKYSTLVLSHVLEHLRFRDVAKLVEMVATKCNWIFVDAPIPLGRDGADWNGYHGTHILEVGWGRVDNLMEIHGYRPVIDGPSIGGYVKFYEATVKR